MASIVIQGAPYPVTITDAHFLDHQALAEWTCGRFSHQDGIQLRHDMVMGSMVSTLLHEALHGIDDALAIGLTEEQVECLTAGVLSLMASNGGSIKWLTCIVDQARAEYDAENEDEDEDDGD